MKFEKRSLEELEHYSVVRLTHIYILSVRFDSFISEEKQLLKQSLEKISSKQLLHGPDLMELAKNEGIISLKDYLELEKSDPQRFKVIFEQQGLRLSKIMAESNYIIFDNNASTITWYS